MAQAALLFHRKVIQGDLILEMILWQLPRRSAERPHGIKYRFYLGSGGQTLVRYDNETGKGDHRHIGDTEELYLFSTIEKLLEDFERDCRQLGWRWE